MIDILLSLFIDTVPCVIPYKTDNPMVVEQLAAIEYDTNMIFVQSDTPIITFTFKRRVNGNDKYAGYVWLTSVNGHLTNARVQIKSTMPLSWQKTAVLHETGHSLGLEHRAGHSIMNPVVSSIATLTRADKKALAAVQCLP